MISGGDHINRYSLIDAARLLLFSVQIDFFAYIGAVRSVSGSLAPRPCSALATQA
jgi:hypothetical protein